MNSRPSDLASRTANRPSSTTYEGCAAALLPRLFLFTCALLLCPVSVALAKKQERILAMDSNIQINADTALTIQERIRILSSGDKVKRGIIREFPAWFTDDLHYKIFLRYLDVTVTRDGKKEPFAFRLEGDTYRLYIGDAHTELTPGEHRYAISYTVLRKLQYFTTYDLLLWNVTGSDWGMPVDRLTATVSLPRLTRPILRYSADINGQGKDGVDFSVAFPERGRAVFTLLRPLQPQEDFSIAVAWPKGLVQEPTAMQYYDNN